MWHAYPMGPGVRSWLDLAANEASSPELRQIDQETKAAFRAQVLSELSKRPVKDQHVLTRLLDELLAMDLPELVLALAAQNPDAWNEADLQALLARGAAAMLREDFFLAESCFRKAQLLAPLEPAPYVNIGQIMLATQREEEAWQWCLAGLGVEPNHFPLWHLIIRGIEQRQGDGKAEIRQLADRFNSWAGISLAAELSAGDTPSLKADLLRPFYEAGEASSSFLVEYTGALGAAELYEGIPAIVWRAKKLLSTPLPWKLLLHGAQAHLVLGNENAFHEMARTLEKRKDVPHEVLAYLHELTCA